MVEVIAVAIGAFLGAAVSGFSGFAFSAVCGAVLLHVFEANRAIPLMMACSITSQLMTIILLRRTVRFHISPWLLMGGMLGVTAAVLAINSVDPQALRRFFGIFLVIYATYLFSKAP